MKKESINRECINTGPKNRTTTICYFTNGSGFEILVLVSFSFSKKGCHEFSSFFFSLFRSFLLQQYIERLALSDLQRILSHSFFIIIFKKKLSLSCATAASIVWNFKTKQQKTGTLVIE